MSINFLDPNCSTNSNNREFGLCDDPPPSKSPAYIEEIDQTIWIAKVNNPNTEKVTFFAIDNCVEVLRADGKMESRCDGVLSYSNNLIFVELKSRKSKKWFKGGREQLTTTIKNFMLHHDISEYSKVEAYVCNKLRPLAHTGQAANIQKFKDDTGFILKGKRAIDII